MEYSMTSCHLHHILVLHRYSFTANVYPTYITEISLTDEVMKMPLKKQRVVIPKGRFGEKMKQLKMQYNVTLWRKLKYKCKPRTWYSENNSGEAISKEHYVSSVTTTELFVRERGLRKNLASSKTNCI